MSPTASLTDSGKTSFASDEEESVYLVRSRILHWIRLGLSFIITIVSIAAVACEAHALKYYHSTNAFVERGLVLWPEQIDLRPSFGLIACGAVIAVFSLGFIIVALLPSPHSRTTLLNILASILAITNLIAAIIPVALSSTLTNPHVANDGSFLGETLHSWACTWTYADGTDENGHLIRPARGFEQVCRETNAAFGLMCALVGLGVVFAAVVGFGWSLQMGMRKKRRVAGVEFGKLVC